MPKTKRSFTALIDAAQAGDLDQMRHIMETSTPYELMGVADRALGECIQKDLPAGVSMLAKACSEQTHLEAFYGAARLGRLQCLKLLAQIIQSPEHAATAVIHAAVGRSQACMDFLMPRADVDLIAGSLPDDLTDQMAPFLSKQGLARALSTHPAAHLPEISARFEALSQARQLDQDTPLPAPTPRAGSRL